MKAAIIKHQSTTNSKGHKLTGSFAFRLKLDKSIREYLGGEIKIRKFDSHYEFSRFGTVDEGSPTILNKSGWLTMPNSKVSEHEDLGEYLVDFDYESECVNLVRV